MHFVNKSKEKEDQDQEGSKNKLITFNHALNISLPLISIKYH